MHRRPRQVDDSAPHYAAAETSETRTTTARSSNTEELRRLSGEPARITLKLTGILVGNYFYEWDNIPIDLRSDMVMAYNEKHRG